MKSAVARIFFLAVGLTAVIAAWPFLTTLPRVAAAPENDVEQSALIMLSGAMPSVGNALALMIWGAGLEVLRRIAAALERY